MEIVIATSNDHKVKEYQEMVRGLNIKFLSLNDINFHNEIIENGKTFEENSLIKALAIKDYTTLPIIADDSGIEIEALGEHFPGIYTHRYAINNGGQEKTNEMLVKTCPNSKAMFTCVITLVNLIDKPLVFKGEFKGRISDKIVTGNGFGYDPIFIPDGLNEPVSTLKDEEKNAISHRGIAFNKLINFLKSNNLI